MIIVIDNTDHTTLWVCTDCYTALSNDDEHVVPDRELLSLIPVSAGGISPGLVATEHDEDCPVFALLPDGTRGEYNGSQECECEHMTFSWSPCKGCGSTLGGTRHALTVWG